MRPKQNRTRTMRIIDLRPELTEWKNGKTHHAGKWSATDHQFNTATRERIIYHYATAMVIYRNDGTGWKADYVSTGNGSVSDQGGVNDLVAYRTKWISGHGCQTYRDYGYRYTRRGGAMITVTGIERPAGDLTEWSQLTYHADTDTLTRRG